MSGSPSLVPLTDVGASAASACAFFLLVLFIGCLGVASKLDPLEDRIRNEYITWTAQDKLFREIERQGWDSLDKYRGRIVNILGKGGWKCKCQAGGKEEHKRRDSWMMWRRTCRARDRVKKTEMIPCGDRWQEQPKEEKTLKQNWCPASLHFALCSLCILVLWQEMQKPDFKIKTTFK